jgi:flagella basal body P-ring formation protein FlgA
VGEDATTYHVLASNQLNMVSIIRIAEDRCVARRWPVDVAVAGTPVWVSANRTISKDEA